MMECGDCTACCEVFAIPETDSPAFSLCKHACKGCTIYAARPQRCKDYECLWLQGGISEDIADRPDQSGLLFSVPDDTRDDEIAQLARSVPGLILVHELEIDACHKPNNKQLLRQLNKDHVLHVYTKDG